MARVYYQEKKLLGKAINYNSVNPMVFENILNKTAPAKNDYFTFRIKSKLITFEKALVWDGDFWFTHKGQEIYLPKAIIFGDDFSVPYPDEYFFVAYIDGEIELRRVFAGKGILFEDTINISQEVVDRNLIQKIDHSMTAINQRVREIENKKSLTNSKVSKPTSSKILDAYTKLTTLCGWSKVQSDSLSEFLLSKNLGNDIYKIRNAVLDFCYSKKQDLFIYRDWKDTIEDFVWELQNILKKNFGIDSILPLGRYNLETQIYEDGVFEYFNDLISEFNLELIRLETDGDDYQFIVSESSNHKEIIQNIEIIGFEI